MNTLNKRRSGDENIGKLIVFAVTIVIAIGLVGLVSYFYTQSRNSTIVTSVMADVNSGTGDINTALEKAGFSSTTPCIDGKIFYHAINDTYRLGKITDANFDSATASTECQFATGDLKGISGSHTGYTISR